MSDQDVKAVVSEVINQVLAESGRPQKDFSDDDVLTGSVGLDSLDLAVMVVSLEQKLGVDPFRAGAQPVPTFGQLVKVYEKTLS